MTRDQKETTERLIYLTAAKLFRDQGYEVTTIRQIGIAAGLNSAAIYYYFSSKEELLFRIMRTVMEDIIETTTKAIAAERDAVEKLRALIRTHIKFHIARPDESVVNDTELRALSPQYLNHMMHLRDQYEDVFYQVLKLGQDSGKFKTRDLKVATYLLITMANGVIVWYRPERRLSEEEVSNIYVDFALGALRSDVELHNLKAR